MANAADPSKQSIRFSEYEDPKRRTGQAYLRCEFLECVAELAPGAMDDLDQIVMADDIEEGVQAWVAMYDLEADWLLDIVRDTVRAWAQYAVAREVRSWDFAPFVGSTGFEPFDFETTRSGPGRTYDPLLETKTAARARLSAAFKLALDAHLDRRDERAEQMGHVRVPRKRRDHLEWVVMRRVLGLSLGEILKRSEGPTKKQAIFEGVKETEKLLGLP